MLDKGQFLYKCAFNKPMSGYVQSFIHALWILSFLKLLNDQYLWGILLNYHFFKYYTR
jgi:hypothetical protein